MFQALFTASRLGVFDLLQSRPELDAAQVAQEIKASVKGTQCLLDACVSLGLLKSRESCQSALVSIDLCVTVTGRAWQTLLFLLSSPSVPKTGLHERSFSPRLPAVWCSSLSGGLHPALWPNRVASLHTPGVCREGRNPPAWEGFWQESKRPVSGDRNCQRIKEKCLWRSFNAVWGVSKDTFYNNQDIKLRFMSAMHSIAKVTGKAVATAFDLSRFKTACDLGGEEWPCHGIDSCSRVLNSSSPYCLSQQGVLAPWPTNSLKPTQRCVSQCSTCQLWSRWVGDSVLSTQRTGCHFWQASLGNFFRKLISILVDVKPDVCRCTGVFILPLSQVTSLKMNYPKLTCTSLQESFTTGLMRKSMFCWGELQIPVLQVNTLKNFGITN